MVRKIPNSEHEITKNYERLPGLLEIITDYLGLPEITRDYQGLPEITIDYHEITGITRDY